MGAATQFLDLVSSQRKDFAAEGVNIDKRKLDWTDLVAQKNNRQLPNRTGQGEKDRVLGAKVHADVLRQIAIGFPSGLVTR